MFDSLVNASILHIANRGLENKGEKTVASIEHGLDKHQTNRKGASCDENVYIKTRLQKACNNKLNSVSTSVIAQNYIKPKRRRSRALEVEKSKVQYIYIYIYIYIYRYINMILDKLLLVTPFIE